MSNKAVNMNDKIKDLNILKFFKLNVSQILIFAFRNGQVDNLDNIKNVKSTNCLCMKCKTLCNCLCFSSSSRFFGSHIPELGIVGRYC